MEERALVEVVPVIEIHNVWKDRGGRKLGPFNLSLPAGYVVALVGHNGSGKSTLLNLLTQLVYPDSGEIHWFGQSYPLGMPSEVRQWIGYLPEQFSKEEDRLTVLEAAAFRAEWYPGWDENRFRYLLTRFRVPEQAKLALMSKGERRKFELAAALAPHPRLLLLDEPSSGLDPFAWKIMMEELRNCMDNGKTTIVVATHIVDEVKRLADYIVLMNEGSTLGMMEKDTLLENAKEIWFDGEIEDALELPGVVEYVRDGSLIRVVTLEAGEASAVLKEAGIHMVRIRSLELDDILLHWSAGQFSCTQETGRDGETDE